MTYSRLRSAITAQRPARLFLFGYYNQLSLCQASLSTTPPPHLRSSCDTTLSFGRRLHSTLSTGSHLVSRALTSSCSRQQLASAISTTSSLSQSPQSLSRMPIVAEAHFSTLAGGSAVLNSTGASRGSGIGTDVEMIAANHRHIVVPDDESRTTHKGMSRRVLNNAKNSSMFSVSSKSFSTTSSTGAGDDDGTDAMKDEYGTMDDSGETFVVDQFVLESGVVLPQAQLRYQTYGSLNEACDNVVVVCHALTGNASLHSWWGDLLGPHRAFDTEKFFVVCCNILGSCYGSTSPTSINPATNEPYGIDFPDISVQDTVRMQLLMLQQHLGVASIKCVIGGSFGGMQALEFAVQGGSQDADFVDRHGRPFVRSVVPIACGAQHTAWQIAISEVQRQAIYKDAQWKAGNHDKATDGLQVARQLGMVSYRTPVGYCDKFGRNLQDRKSEGLEYGAAARWRVKSYLEYQGQKFLSRFDPVTYVKLTEQMDSHDVTRNRTDGSKDPHNALTSVLSAVEIPALVLGIDSDVLYPLREQEELASLLSNAQLKIIHSDDGHDGFLLEQEQVGSHIMEFLQQHE